MIDTSPPATPAETLAPTEPIVSPVPAAPTRLQLRDLVVVRPDWSDGAIVNDVIAFRSRFLAAGSFGGPSDEPRRVAVWSSADGLDWSTVVDDDAFATTFPTYVGLPGAGGIVALAGSPETVVGVGGFGSGWGSGAKAGAWYSTDGSDWHQGHVAGDKGAFMLDVTAGGPGFVAVGATTISTTQPATGAIWASPDGIDWTRVSAGNLFANAIPDRVLMTDTGLLVALGLDKRALDACSNCFGVGYLVWTSHDGKQWTRRPSLKLAYAEDTDAFGVAGARIVALHEGELLATSDGSAWATLDAAPGDFGAVLLGTSSDVLAIGPTVQGEDDATVPAAWRWTTPRGWGPPTLPIGADIPHFLRYGGAAAWGGVVVVVAGYDDERNGCSCYPVGIVLRGNLGE